ncbi:hypothetical protein [Aeoliella sp.]|uniref:hypothetical protein n=1 Tax=Aeoliella sp. TaxID=2795800 RepID=UPI003CCB84C0
MKRAVWASPWTLAVALVFLWSTSQRAGALNLVMTFNSGASDAPAYDPDGSKLTALFAYAESFYQGVFQDNHTLNIEFYYDELDDSIGSHTLQSQNSITSGSSNYRENSGRVRIEPDFNWFLDPTPEDNSEFNMQQTLWRDITADQRSDWYNDFDSNTADTFEVGYTGSAISGTDASGKWDLLSVVLHEVGHALGMSSSNYGTQHETDLVALGIFGGENDDEYDFSTSWTGGGALAVETANDSGDDNDNIAHLENTFALMTPSIPSNRRRLPSHTDLFAMAAGHHYSSIDAPRREFYSNGGGTDWNNVSNWTGTEAPESGDDAYVRAARGAGVNLTARLSANGAAANLYVSEGSDVDTSSFKLDVSDAVTLADSGSRIFIGDGGELEADTLDISNAGQVHMTAGLLDIRDTITVAGASSRIYVGNGGEMEVEEVTIDADALIRVGGGLLDVGTLEIGPDGGLESYLQGAAVIQVDTLLVNDGLIDTDLTDGLPSSMTFQATGAAEVWDLDGTGGDGFVRANEGDIVFESGSLTDSFGGTMEVGAGYRIHITEPWTNNAGLLDLRGGATIEAAAKFTGGTITFTGGTLDADDSGDSFAAIEAPLTATGGTITIGASDTLVLAGATSFGNVDVTMAASSKLQVDGAIAFTATTDITSTGAPVVVELNCPVNWGSGTLNLGSSGITLQVNTTDNAPWVMSGTLSVMGGPDASLPLPTPVQGAPMQVIGTLQVREAAALAVDVEFKSTGQLSVASSNDRLALAGSSTFRAGASVVGAGTLENSEGASLTMEAGAALGNLDNHGTILPGDLIGGINAESFVQQSTGSITFVIGGPAMSDEYTSLSISGAATLSGLATVEFDGYLPDSTQLYRLVSAAAGVSGSFDEVILPDLEGRGWWLEHESSRSYLIEAIVPLMGDVNLDGQITAGSGNPATDDIAAFVAGWRSVLATPRRRRGSRAI